MEMGLSFAAVADPLSPAPATAPSALFAQVAVQLFLALGLDHACVRVLATSTKAHPLGTAEVSSDAIASMVALGSSMLVNALSLAVPVMAAIFALKVALAFLARAAPKLQIFSLAFGISILVGLAVLEAATPGIVASLGRQLREGVETLSRFALVA
jgi:flagellar biosynthetic protein FliR